MTDVWERTFPRFRVVRKTGRQPDDQIGDQDSVRGRRRREPGLEEPVAVENARCLPWDVSLTATIIPSHGDRGVRPDRPVRERVLVQRLGAYLDAWPDSKVRHSGRRERRRGRVLVKVVDPLDDAVLRRAADRDVVEEREVLDVLAQSDTAGVGAHGDLELGRQEKIAIASFRRRPHRVEAEQASIASAWNSCLKMTRFWMCSPVAMDGRDVA